MEFDRYQRHHKLYIIGIISLLLCLSLLFLSLYLLPFLIWKLNYDIPEMVNDLIAYLEDKKGYSDAQSRTIIGAMFLIPILITGFISYYVSNLIDNEIYKSELPLNEVESRQHTEEVNKDIRESATISFEIIILMILVLAGLFVLQLLI